MCYFSKKKKLRKSKRKKKKYLHVFTENEITKISKKRGLVNHISAEISAEVPCRYWSDGCKC